MSDHIFSDRQVISRLLWKEFRQVRTFALLLLISGIAAQCYYVAGAVNGAKPAILSSLIFVATLVPILFAIGCGVTVFSNEHENKTFLFQRTLPTSRFQVLATKIGLVAVGTGLLFFINWSGVQFYQWRQGDSILTLDWAPMISALTVTELFVWSVFFSADNKRPIHVIGWTIFAGVGLTFVIERTMVVLVSDLNAQDVFTVSTRCFVLLGLMAATVPKVRRWYVGEESGRRKSAIGRLALDIDFANRPPSMFRSLIWIQVRSGLPLMLMATALGICSLFVLTSGTLLLFAVGAVSASIGVTSVRGVQQNRRLLLQMGANPLGIGASQCLLPVLLVAAMALFYSYYPAERSDPYSGWGVQGHFGFLPTSWCWAAGFLGLAIGIFFALLHRSFLVSWVAALASVAVFLYSAWTVVAIDMSWHGAYALDTGDLRYSWALQLTMLVVAIGLFLSAIAVFSNWLKAERTDRLGCWEMAGSKRRLLAMTCLLALAPIAHVAVAVYEVPYVSDRELERMWAAEDRVVSVVIDSSDPTQGKSPNSKLKELVDQLWVGQTYEFRRYISRHTYRVLKWLGQPYYHRWNAEVMAKNLDWLPYERLGSDSPGYLRKGLHSLLVVAIENGDSETCLTALKMWIQLGGLSRQTAYRVDGPIGMALRWMELPATKVDDIRELIQLIQMQDLRHEFYVEEWQYYQRQKRMIGQRDQKGAMWPWERALNLRVLNYRVWQTRLMADHVDQRILERRAITDMDRGLDWGQYPNWMPHDGMTLRDEEAMFVRTVRDHKAAILQLAIGCWRKEHGGKFPIELEQLVGLYVPEVPIDPLSARPFGYYPHGITTEWKLRPIHVYKGPGDSTIPEQIRDQAKGPLLVADRAGTYGELFELRPSIHSVEAIRYWPWPQLFSQPIPEKRRHRKGRQ